ncbi:hypothetical protein OAQ85_04325 [Schleiferiaceae bacterium]|nr:hypothetical protein [Schleiferiaceae bacterium]|tara:strand:- start:877 stop:1371 length:495 start_codon:yes stop_codon:yes gene_type:complete
MKKIIIVLLAAFIVSCKTVYYEDPQPIKWPAIPSFPKSIQGTYPAFGQKDAIVIKKKQLIIGSDEDDAMVLQLNEGVVIKRYAGHWVISVYDKEYQAWDVYAIDNDRLVKTLIWQNGMDDTLNAHFGKTIFVQDAEDDLIPLQLKRREFKYILKKHFSGVDLNK